LECRRFWESIKKLVNAEPEKTVFADPMNEAAPPACRGTSFPVQAPAVTGAKTCLCQRSSPPLAPARPDTRRRRVESRRIDQLHEGSPATIFGAFDRKS